MWIGSSWKLPAGRVNCPTFLLMKISLSLSLLCDGEQKDFPTFWLRRDIYDLPSPSACVRGRPHAFCFALIMGVAVGICVCICYYSGEWGERRECLFTYLTPSGWTSSPYGKRKQFEIILNPTPKRAFHVPFAGCQRAEHLSLSTTQITKR